jgi:flavin-dependent dehydrogenase
MYDAIVVGARCAGSPTAMLLARRGYRVLMVDRATFPSDTLSTHFLHLSGLALLDEWGLLDTVRRSGCPALRTLAFDVGPVRLVGSPDPAGGVDEMLCCRRTTLDHILVDAAAAAGADVRQGFTVDSLVHEGSRVVGITGRDRRGRTVTERAPIVIGADGRRSLVARAVDAAEYDSVAPLAGYYYSYWSGFDTDRVEFYPRDGRVAGVLPTNDGLTCLFVGARQRDFSSFRRNPERFMADVFNSIPPLAPRVTNARREERLRGVGDLRNFFRRPWGNGWALVGDAGCHKDPILGHGISDAFRDAALLADAVDRGLSGVEPLQAALADYERRRNDIERPRYQYSLQHAALDAPTPELVALFRALAGNPRQTRRFFGTYAGTVPVAEFMSDANLGEILAA